MPKPKHQMKEHQQQPQPTLVTAASLPKAMSPLKVAATKATNRLRDQVGESPTARNVPLALTVDYAGNSPLL